MDVIVETATDVPRRKPSATYVIVALMIAMLIALGATFVVARYRQERKWRETRQLVQSAGGELLSTHPLFIQFSGDAITDADLLEIRQLANTKDLNLHQTRISDDGLAAIVHWKNLEYLGIQGNLLTDSALTHVQEFTQLERLELIGQPITDAGLVRLAKLKNLKVLDLNCCTNLTEPAVRNLRAALPNCEIRWSTEPFVPVPDAK